MSFHCVSWVLEYSPVSVPGHRLVLVVLADHAKKDGTYAWPAVKTIAHEARLSERSVQYALRNLEEGGHIVRTGTSSKGTAIWTVPMPVPRGGADIAPGGVQGDDSGGATVAPEPSKNGPEKKEIVEIFDHWRSVMGKSRAMLTPERRQKVRARLEQGYSVERLCRAIDGCAGSDWHMGRDQKTAGKEYNELARILKSGAEVERFEAMPVPAVDAWSSQLDAAMRLNDELIGGAG